MRLYKYYHFNVSQGNHSIKSYVSTVFPLNYMVSLNDILSLKKEIVSTSCVFHSLLFFYYRTH